MRGNLYRDSCDRVRSKVEVPGGIGLSDYAFISVLPNPQNWHNIHANSIERISSYIYIREIDILVYSAIRNDFHNELSVWYLREDFIGQELQSLSDSGRGSHIPEKEESNKMENGEVPCLGQGVFQTYKWWRVTVFVKTDECTAKEEPETGISTKSISQVALASITWTFLHSSRMPFFQDFSTPEWNLLILPITPQGRTTTLKRSYSWWSWASGDCQKCSPHTYHEKWLRVPRSYFEW